jgi:hypothetical protein
MSDFTGVLHGEITWGITGSTEVIGVGGPRRNTVHPPLRGLMIFWCADARCHAVARQLYHSPQFRSQFCFPDRNVPMWGVGSRQDSQALLHEAGHYKQMAPNRPSLPRRQRNRSSVESAVIRAPPPPPQIGVLYEI